MKRNTMLMLTLLALPLLSCGGGGDNASSIASSSAEEKKESVELVDKINGKAIDLVYKPAREYLESDDPAYSLSNAIANQGDNTEPLNLRWKVSNGKGRYALEIAYDESFTDLYATYEDLRASISSLDVYNLVPGTYYYRVKGDNAVSEIDSFSIKGTLRTIDTNDAIINMRDLGGWKIDDTHRVKYSLLYRSASWAGIDKACESRLKALSMKTELDIRYSTSSADYSASQHAISGISFLNYGMGQYDSIVPGAGRYYEDAKANLKNIFDVLGKKESYPLTFHCSAGADRTGTLAFLINGLLGVDYSDLCKDFELTSYYNSRRWRSNIVDGKFDDTGVMQDDSDNYVAFGLLYSQMVKHYKTEEGSLSGAIENYLKSACSISQATIDSIKEILIEAC